MAACDWSVPRRGGERRGSLLVLLVWLSVIGGGFVWFFGVIGWSVVVPFADWMNEFLLSGFYFLFFTLLRFFLNFWFNLTFQLFFISSFVLFLRSFFFLPFFIFYFLYLS